MHTTRCSATPVVFAIVVISSMAAIAGPARAATGDYPWIIERQTWLASYLTALEATVKTERAAGIILPPPATSGKLPIFAYSEVNNVDDDVTVDIDVVPERTDENLERLAEALCGLGARIRTEGEPDGLTFDCSARFFRNLPPDAIVNMTTASGDLDAVLNWDSLTYGGVGADTLVNGAEIHQLWRPNGAVV